MQIHHLSENNSVLNHFLSEIRNVDIQKDSMRFRRNIERIGEIMSYELSKNLDYNPITITTPLGKKDTSEIANQLVLCSILRAGLALHQGFLNYFDQAENGFISAYRTQATAEKESEIFVEYQAIPVINDKILLLVDPMLATGQSMVAVFNKLLERGTPKEIHLAVVVAAPQGIEFLKEHIPANCHLWIATVDEGLDKKNYIIPGLGDAGDLAYGSKL